jgi:hypothetical protein
MTEHQCPQEPRFYFHSCTIRTCKNWIKDGSTHCFELDVKKAIGDKTISDAELKLFKLNHKDVTLRQIAFDRQHAINAVKNLIMLHKLVEYIKDSYKKERVVFNPLLAKELKRVYPFKIRRLGVEAWVIAYVYSEEVFKKFLKLKVGGSREIRLHELLGLTELKFNKQLNLLKVQING